MKKIVLLCCLQLFCFEKLQSTTEDFKHSNEPIFVSLGSHCEVGIQLKYHEVRSAAFPFDWLITCDHKGFVAALEEDFSFFMDKSFLQWHPRESVINVRYNIDFRHDWPDSDFEKYYPEIREKYERRIQRFMQLNDQEGMVYFVRAPFDLDLDPWIPHLPTLTPMCTRIDNVHAEALRNVLVKKFPNLNFFLVIINYVEEEAPDLVNMDRVIEVKVRKTHKTEDYKEFIQHLIKHGCR